MFKIVNGFGRVKAEKLFPVAEGVVTRGHRFKVIGKRTRGNRRFYFTQRVVVIWNALSEREVEADSTVIFRRELVK